MTLKAKAKKVVRVQASPNVAPVDEAIDRLFNEISPYCLRAAETFGGQGERGVMGQELINMPNNERGVKIERADLMSQNVTSKTDVKEAA